MDSRMISRLSSALWSAIYAIEDAQADSEGMGFVDYLYNDSYKVNYGSLAELKALKNIAERLTARSGELIDMISDVLPQ